jgi:hypothetical protein
MLSLVCCDVDDDYSLSVLRKPSVISDGSGITSSSYSEVVFVPVAISK